MTGGTDQPSPGRRGIFGWREHVAEDQELSVDFGVDFSEHLEALRESLDSFVSDVRGAGLDAPVPTAPEWDVRALIAHQGMVHRWATDCIQGKRVDASAYETEGLESCRPGRLAARRRPAPDHRAERGTRRPRGLRLPQRRPGAAPVLGPPAVPRDHHPLRRRTRREARPDPDGRRDLGDPAGGSRRHRRAAHRLHDPSEVRAAHRRAGQHRRPAQRRQPYLAGARQRGAAGRRARRGCASSAAPRRRGPRARRALPSSSTSRSGTAPTR